MSEQITFDKLGLSKQVLDTITKKGFEVPSEIQARIIPLVLEKKHDIIGVSKTGSGKTASFGLPLIDLIKQTGRNPKVIILAPTRELALQVTSEMNSFKGKSKLKMLTVYGGAAIRTQISELKQGIDIVVGTPGRVLDLIDRKALKLQEVEYFILDEADEMLKMGFIEDIETIFQTTPKNKKVLLFSATMPEKIKRLSKKYMQNQLIIEANEKVHAKLNIEQKYFVVKREEKFPMIKNIIENTKFFYGIIFCMTKSDVNELTQKIKRSGFSADCIHGDIPQSKRERILKGFRDQKITVLVATDVAARGIDVSNLTHVINHSLPKETEIYTHRIGRTGRAGKSGIAISLITPKQMFMLKEIEKLTDIKFTREQVPKDLPKEEKFDMSRRDNDLSSRRRHSRDRADNFKEKDRRGGRRERNSNFRNDRPKRDDSKREFSRDRNSSKNSRESKKTSDKDKFTKDAKDLIKELGSEEAIKELLKKIKKNK